MRKNLVILFFMLIGVTCTYAAKRTSFDFQKEDAILKVMSFNIRFNNPKDSAETSWDMRRQPCMDMIHDVMPDVIGMQEPRNVMWGEILSLLPDYQSSRIAAEEGVTDKETGDVMLLWRKDRLFMLETGRFWLSETYYQPSTPWNSTDTHVRAAIWAHLKDRYNGKDFYVVNTHLPYKKADVDTEVRAKCVQLIIDRMKKIAGNEAPVFVVGDMNASTEKQDPRSPSLKPFDEWMKNARNTANSYDGKLSHNGFGKVIDPKIKSRNIDHIYYRNAYALDFITITDTKYGVKYISDHYPILCSFTY